MQSLVEYVDLNDSQMNVRSSLLGESEAQSPARRGSLELDKEQLIQRSNSKTR